LAEDNFFNIFPFDNAKIKIVIMIGTTSRNDFQEKIHNYIFEVIIPEASAIYGTQHLGSKPEISCGLILEGGLKNYLRKIDPQIKFKKTAGLGTFLGICYTKRLLTPKFRQAIKKINSARVDKAHPEAEGKEVTLYELRTFTLDFIKWFFDEVSNQEIPQEIVNIIPSLKVESYAASVMPKKPKRKEPDGKKTAAPYERVFLNLKIGSHFSRTYYEDIEIKQSSMRGVGSTFYKSLEGVILQVLFAKDGVYFTNRSEGPIIKLNSTRLVKNRKRLIDSELFELSMGEVKFTGSVTKY
jgi:hypothetical protein